MTRLRSTRRQRTTPSLSRRASLDDLRKLGHLLGRKPGLRAFRPVIEKPLKTGGVEAVNPVAKRLAVHAADPRGRPSVHAVPDRSQRQKPPALVDVLGPTGEPPKRLRRIVLPQSYR